MKKIFAVLISSAFVFVTAHADDHMDGTHTSSDATKSSAAQEANKTKAQKKRGKMKAGSTDIDTQSPVAPAGERDGSGNEPNNAVNKDGSKKQ